VDESLLISFADLEERHWWFVVRRQIVLSAIESSDIKDDADVVEVGCGTGGFARELGRRHPDWRILGVEPSEQAAGIARARGCEVVLGSFESLPAEDRSLDLVVALDVLEHCEFDGAASSEAARALKPGGRFVLTVPALPSLWSSHDDANRHYRRYTRSTLHSALDGAGFAVDRMTYFNSFLLPAGYVSRFISRATGSRKALGVDLPVAPVNATMKAVFSAEAALVSRVDLPLGMSLLAVCSKRNTTT
jgi:SAM-dependent methyltransferase